MDEGKAISLLMLETCFMHVRKSKTKNVWSELPYNIAFELTTKLFSAQAARFIVKETC
jgi:16S rRNA A1518/A1519 N6-dimethyltransferase RsmA/KsgA/DIM1 with predicted DNA glycosylase/AP lyase activity